MTADSLNSFLVRGYLPTPASGPSSRMSGPASTGDLTSDILCPQCRVRRLEQAARPENQHDHHDQVDPVAAERRVVDLQERLDDAYDQRRDDRAAHASEPADQHDSERLQNEVRAQRDADLVDGRE